jgi:hypothetical protein
MLKIISLDHWPADLAWRTKRAELLSGCPSQEKIQEELQALTTHHKTRRAVPLTGSDIIDPAPLLAKWKLRA